MTERTKPADTTEENDESGKDGAQQIVDFGSALTKTPHGSVYCMTIIGQIEGHNTFSALLEMGVIPVVNENDSVSSAEIETGRHKVLGDNDTLSAIVAELCRADLLVLLSDIDGLYDADPKTHPEAKLLHQVTELTPEILEMAGGAGSWRGTGGMATKLSAARIAMEAGCDMVITNGRRMEDLYGIAEGKDIGTRFVSGKTRN